MLTPINAAFQFCDYRLYSVIGTNFCTWECHKHRHIFLAATLHLTHFFMAEGGESCRENMDKFF